MAVEERNVRLELLKLKNVCRLCSGKIELVWVFDKKFDYPQTMQDILIAITTIQVTKDDQITQKICTKCVAVAIKMFQFRDQCIRNDAVLRAKYEDLTKCEKPATSVEMKTEKKTEEAKPEVKIDAKPQKSKVETKHNDVAIDNKQPPKPTKTIHKVDPSITALFKLYPQIRLPAVCLKSNIQPSVVMEMDAVENYFRSRKLNMHNYVQTALKKTHQVAKKSTASRTKSKRKLTIPQIFLSLRTFRKPHKVSKDEDQGKSNDIDLTESNRSSASRQSSSSQDSIQETNRSRTRISSSSIGSRKSKRSISNDSSSSERSAKKQNTRDSTSSPSSSSRASPAFSISSHSDGAPDFTIAASRDMFVCNICNSVYSAAATLKKHQQKHLRCQFCKATFKTLEIKEKHIESECQVQKRLISINLPDIPLEKIETNLKIRQKYHKAFAPFNFPVIKDSTKDKLESKSLGPSKKDAGDVIEILSDEDEELPKTPASTKRTTEVLINPDVKIKDSGLNVLLLENVSDIKLIKSLLTQYNKLNRKVNDATQTFLPTNELIKVDHEDLSIQMKSLKQHLFYYKIPIEVNCGPSMNVRFKYDSGCKPVKNLQYWDNIVPVDVNFRINEGSQAIKEELTEEGAEEELLVEEIYNNCIPVVQTAVTDVPCESPNLVVVPGIPEEHAELKMELEEDCAEKDNDLSNQSEELTAVHLDTEDNGTEEVVSNIEISLSENAFNASLENEEECIEKDNVLCGESAEITTINLDDDDSNRTEEVASYLISLDENNFNASLEIEEECVEKENDSYEEREILVTVNLEDDDDDNSEIQNSNPSTLTNVNTEVEGDEPSNTNSNTNKEDASGISKIKQSEENPTENDKAMDIEKEHNINKFKETSIEITKATSDADENLKNEMSNKKSKEPSTEKSKALSSDADENIENEMSNETFLTEMNKVISSDTDENIENEVSNEKSSTEMSKAISFDIDENVENEMSNEKSSTEMNKAISSVADENIENEMSNETFLTEMNKVISSDADENIENETFSEKTKEASTKMSKAISSDVDENIEDKKSKETLTEMSKAVSSNAVENIEKETSHEKSKETSNEMNVDQENETSNIEQLKETPAEKDNAEKDVQNSASNKCVSSVITANAVEETSNNKKSSDNVKDLDKVIQAEISESEASINNQVSKISNDLISSGTEEDIKDKQKEKGTTNICDNLSEDNSSRQTNDDIRINGNSVDSNNDGSVNNSFIGFNQILNNFKQSTSNIVNDSSKNVICDKKHNESDRSDSQFQSIPTIRVKTVIELNK